MTENRRQYTDDRKKRRNWFVGMETSIEAGCSA